MSGEDSSDFYETEDQQGSNIIETQSKNSAKGNVSAQINDHLDTSNTVSAPNIGTRTAAGPSLAAHPASASTPIDSRAALQDSNNSAQLSQFMNFVLKKAGIQTTPSIDAADLLRSESSQFIEKIIKNLQKVGSSTDQLAHRDDSNDVDEEMDDVNEKMDDEDKKLFEKAKKIWDDIEQRFSNEMYTSCLPDPCQGVGLWCKLSGPTKASQIKEQVREAIFRFRNIPSTSDDVVGERLLDLFKDMRSMELKYQGFTVCEGFLKSDEPNHWVTSYLRYYMKYFIGEGGTGTERNGESCPWESIVNLGTGQDEEPLKKGIGHY